MSEDSYDEGLDSMIEKGIDAFEFGRDEVWSQMDEGDLILEVADELAQFVLDTSEKLVFGQGGATSSKEWTVLHKLSGTGSFSSAVHERIQIAIARRFAPHTDEMATRCFELAREVLATKPSEPVLRYLKRLSRCYIAGFEPECVMVSRSVLEHAITDKFARMQIPMPATPEGKSEMKTRIEFAHRVQWLTNKGKASAVDVWKRGSKAVHEDPEATKDIAGTVKATISVLQELYRS